MRARVALTHIHAIIVTLTFTVLASPFSWCENFLSLWAALVRALSETFRQKKFDTDDGEQSKRRRGVSHRRECAAPRADVIVCATLAYLDLRAHLRLRATNRRFGRLSERPESAPASVALIVPKEQQVSSVLHTLSTLRAPGLELKEDREVRLRWYDNKDWVSHGVTNESLACLSRMTWLRDLEVRVRAGHASGDRMQGELLAPLVQLRSVSLTLEQCTVDLATLAPLTRLETLRVAWHGGRYVGEEIRWGARSGACRVCAPCVLEHRGGGTPESVFSWAHDGPTLPAESSRRSTLADSLCHCA